MRARLRSLGLRGADGAATLEYAAAIAVAGLFVGAVVVTFSGLRIEAIAERAICSVKAILGGSRCSVTQGNQPPPTAPPLDPKPKKCKITEHSEKVNSEIKIAFIKIGENAGFIETTYTDGTVTYTATDGAEVGLTGGFGSKLDIGKLERGVQVDFGAGMSFEYGSTWVFRNAEEAEEMREQLDKYLAEQETLRHDTSGGYAIYLALRGATDPPKPPTQQVSTFEVESEAGAKVGLSLPWDLDPDGESGVPNLTLAEAGLKFGGSGKWTQIVDTRTGTTTWTTGGEVFGQLGAQAGPVAGELKGVLGSSMSITRDKDDQITKVTLVTTREGRATGTLNSGQNDLGGNLSDSNSVGMVTVTTTTLEVTTDAQRALVNNWLAAQANDADGAVSPQTYYPDRLVPGDAFPEPHVHECDGEQRAVQQRVRQARLCRRSEDRRCFRRRLQPGDHRLAGDRRHLSRRPGPRRRAPARSVRGLRRRMINSSWPPSPADPPIEIGTPTARVDNRVAWRPLLLRMFVVVPPAQVLGTVAGAQLMAGTGLLERMHWLSAVISVISGVLSGLAVGFFLTPKVRQRRVFALVAAGFGLTTWVVLAVLSEVRLAGWGVEPYWYRYVLGAALVVGMQTPIAWSIWVSRSRHSAANVG